MNYEHAVSEWHMALAIYSHTRIDCSTMTPSNMRAGVYLLSVCFTALAHLYPHTVRTPQPAHI